MPLSGEYEPSGSAFSRRQVELYESSGGTRGTTVDGVSVVVLTTVGSRSKKLRKTPVMRVEHGGCYAAVASLAGAPRNPAWYHNLLAHPVADLQDGAVKQNMTARELTGDERALWWGRAVAVWREYADYQRKTERLIPVMLLVPTIA
ncbi:nitroreductase family deazaflavin-dependent oxidoreductase [Streptomyces sp. NBC_01622]|uniref:nitroreductase family deazaflavin-dependent oxidoreductase n=1 Tax=Streptomyces sp. NBC_01622 TaxID=2975903 RepID=UPI00386D92D6|nr:nitroreductase family deazaflavin-dependent oxidoreductase [Streptomyces sp. NBC_01622]